MNELLQQLLNGLASGTAYALIAIGLNLIIGVGRIGNFAHGEFVMISAYTMVILAPHTGFVAACIGALVVGVVVAVASHTLVFSRVVGRSMHVIFVAAIGLSALLQSLALMFFGPTPRQLASPLDDYPLRAFGLVISGPRWFGLIVGIALCVLLSVFLARSPMGKRITAMGQNPMAAEVIGLRPRRVVAQTFAVSGVLAAVAAILLLPVYGVFPTFGVILMLKAFAIVIVAGMGSIWRNFAVALGVGALESLTSGYVASELRDAVPFVVLGLFLVASPHGMTRVTAAFGKG